ncbi:MAG: DUF192 domain-containing protein [archaeon]
MKIILASFIALMIILLGSWQELLKDKSVSPPSRSASSVLTIDEAEIAVEIADTLAARARGLSGRRALAEDAGLLFVFDTADYHGFWMKEMNFPIDIIWFDDDWRVVGITPNATPQDFPKVYQPPAPTRYVLEVNAGFAAVHHLGIGTQARW